MNKAHRILKNGLNSKGKKNLVAMVAVEGFLPIADDFFAKLTIEADLDGEVRIGVAIIKIPPFSLLIELDEDFFVVPGLGQDVEVFDIEPGKLSIGLVPLIEGIVPVITHEDLDDFFRLRLKTLDVEIDFGADHVLRILIIGGVVGIGVVDRAAVPAGDDDLSSGLRLNLVEKVDQDRINELPSFSHGQAMLLKTAAIEIVDRLSRIFMVNVDGV